VGRTFRSAASPGRHHADLQRDFEAASEAVKQLAKRPDNQTLLKLYALYKQATAGDVSGSRPGASTSRALPSTTPGPR